MATAARVSERKRGLAAAVLAPCMLEPHRLATTRLAELPLTHRSPEPEPTRALQPMTPLESVFHTAPAGLCLLDRQYRWITVNACLARMWGLPVESFAGRSVYELLPNLALQMVEQMERALAEGGTVESEIAIDNGGACTEGRLHHADLAVETLFYRRMVQPVRDASGQVHGFSVALVDITERKRAEAALRESEENYRYTVELSPHIPWTAEDARALTFGSPRWEALTGMRERTVLLEDWLKQMHTADRSMARDRWEGAQAPGAAFDADVRLLCADGSWRWMRARAFARRDARGKVSRWYGTMEDVHDRKLLDAALTRRTLRLQKATAELALRAREDHLTGLANRRTFDAALERELDRAEQTGMPLSLLMIDVDHFKRYNDAHGHPAGDACLQAVAAALNGALRRTGDLAARYGGEEFALILPNTPEAGALEVGVRALEAVRALRLRHGAGAEHGVTISVGMAIVSAEIAALEGMPARALIQAADGALYAAKRNGRDQMVGAR